MGDLTALINLHGNAHALLPYYILNEPQKHRQSRPSSLYLFIILANNKNTPTPSAMVYFCLIKITAAINCCFVTKIFR
ncbi:hypothetical protein B0189_06995 [Moraxella cuniculi]|nr:hypothetical protein B0189_06995 [Moraxella cuniculi]